MTLGALFSRKVRGFRLVDLIGVGLLVALIVGVYLAKTIAGRERAEIATIERQISTERSRIRLLQAEVAHLEQPGRLERLAVGYLKMEPVTANRETTVDQIPVIARLGPPKKGPAASAVAALIDGSYVTPGVPPPPPAEAGPVHMAQAEPQPGVQP